ncbi:MAG: hypothetical protein ACK4NS_00240 [Saprospiraceae bacterium]
MHDINVVAFIFAFNIAHAQLHYDARGTGRSTGIVAWVQVYNPTPEAMRVVLGDCFIPAHSGHQGYVIPQAYPTEIAPFGSVKIELEGYCTLAQAPPAAEGWALPDVSLWTSWAAAAPLPEAGKPLGPPFVAAITTADDPLTLTYPGTQTPMPYVLDFDRYPQHGARLLLHAAYAAGAAFDQLAQEGKVNPVAAGRPLPTLRQDLIQQYVWAFSARLAGQSYDKGDFYIQLVEEAEQQLNQPISAFSPEERQSLERQSQDVWANVSLVGAAAKLIPPHTGPRVETLRAQPVSAGSPIDLSATLLERMQTTSPTQWNALDQLTPVLLFLQQTNENPEYQTLKQAILEKWRTALKYQIERIDPPSPFAVRDAVTAIGWVQSRPSQVIPYEERQRLLTTLYEKIDAALRYSAKTLHPGQADFLTRWRMLKSATNQPWYAACCRRSNSLQDLPNPSGAVRITAPFRPAALALSGEHWKHAIPITPSAAKLPKKFSWWIPAIGLPAAGGAVYFATRKRKLPTPLPPPPRATDDAVSLACGGQTMVDPLANDSGARITLSSINAPTGIGATAVGNTVLIQASGVGAFLIAYTITDSLGRAASANIVATVTDADPPAISCPPPVAVDCGQQNNLDITGQATATDICAGPIAPTFADNPPVFAGCEGIIQRTWTAADPSGNSASCIQTITVQDQTPPVFTLCPPPISAPIGQQNNLSVTGMAAATDACKPPVVEPTFVDDLSGFGSCGGTIVRNWTATDDCGNTAACAQPITVFDADPPAISCPPPVAVDCGQQNNLDITGQATATDNCAGPIAPTFADNPPVFAGCEGLIQRTWTAADPSGNSAHCTQEITVKDHSAPVFTFCPPAVTVACGQQNDLNITGAATAQDACAPSAAVTHSDATIVFPACVNAIFGQVLRTFNAADPCGNSATCTQTISLRDVVPPTLVCPDLVQVQCGQQNNHDITGAAVAFDDCGAPVTTTHSDNLDEFVQCEGVIFRTFLSVDACGNTATCVQPIVVVNVPCNFTALFGVSTPVCGRCVGSVSAFVDPPGDYAYLWNTGHTTPNLNNVCPGNYTVTITHLNEECSDIYTVTVGNTPNLMLTVLQVNHPASPGASNGSVVLQVGPAPPWSIPPFQVFVNGSPIGFANTNTFQIVNMPPGEYVIWVVDQGGSGCMSSHVFVFLIPGGMAEPPALSLNTAGAPLTLPAAGSPEHPSALAAALWPAGPGLTLTLPFGRFGQMRLERQSYLGLHPGLAPLSWAERVGAGYRRYWPLERQPRYWLFSESALALMCLWPQTIQETRGPLPQLALGGGADASLWRSLRVEAGANLAIWPTLEHNRWQLGAYVRAYLPLQGRQRPMGIQGLD